jgi:hypothetical protein
MNINHIVGPDGGRSDTYLEQPMTTDAMTTSQALIDAARDIEDIVKISRKARVRHIFRRMVTGRFDLIDRLRRQDRPMRWRTNRLTYLHPLRSTLRSSG